MRQAITSSYPGTDTRRLTIRWNDFHWCVDVIDCHELITGFRHILRGWDVSEISVTKSDDPAMVFWKSGKGYDWVSSWEKQTASDLYGKPESIVAAVCDFHYLSMGWIVDRFDNLLTLHCAGVEFNNGVVLFPGTHRAGKSLLSVALSARGHRIFGDDVLAINPQKGTALGLGMLPRVRLPLPPQAAGKELRDFIVSNTAMRDDEHLYVELDNDRLANAGQSLPIHAIVQIRRTNKKTPASIEPVATGSALRALISQNYNTSMQASHLFDHLERIAKGVATYSLTYHRIEDAITVLEDCLADNSTALRHGQTA